MTEEKGSKVDAKTVRQALTIFQVIVTIPVFVFLVRFIVFASQRPQTICYTLPIEYNANQLMDECMHMRPLSQMVYFFLLVAFFWAHIVAYLTIVVPRQKLLITRYLAEGEPTVGDIHYMETPSWTGAKSEYGFLVYPHPNFEIFPAYIGGKVRVHFKRAREAAPVLLIPGMIFSGQPKEDLEVAFGIFERDRLKHRFWTWFSIGWLAFSVIGAGFILSVISNIGVDYQWQPEYNGLKASKIFTWVVFVAIPFSALSTSFVIWRRHQYVMMRRHKMLKDGDKTSQSVATSGADQQTEASDYKSMP